MSICSHVQGQLRRDHTNVDADECGPSRKKTKPVAAPCALNGGAVPLWRLREEVGSEYCGENTSRLMLSALDDL